MKKKVKNSFVRDIKDDGIPSIDVCVNPNVPSVVKTSTFEEVSKTEEFLYDTISNPSIASIKRSDSSAHWYVLRCTYGRERKAYDFFIKEGFKTFYPFITTFNSIDENTKVLSIPNILFVYGTFEQLKEYVYDNVHADTKYLRFYYDQCHDVGKHPLVIPNDQMDSLIKMCAIKANDKHLDPYVVEKFKNGTVVKVVDGPFAGIEGVAGRYKGQQRIGLVVGELFTVTTSYIPKDFIEF